MVFENGFQMVPRGTLESVCIMLLKQNCHNTFSRVSVILTITSGGEPEDQLWCV